MSWGPVRSASLGGLAFGLIVILVGILLFLWSQDLLPFELNLGSFCAMAMIVLGAVIIGGFLWGRRFMRGGWRRWVSDWDQDWDRPPPSQ